MKTYNKLPLPPDSAWNRKGYDPIRWVYHSKKEWPEWAEKAFDLWFVPKRFVKDFFDFCKRVCIWVPVLWKDRDWDDSFIFEILKKKLETQRKYLVHNYRHTSIPQTNRDITICLNLVERFQHSHYEVEHFDYYDVDIDFVELERNEELSDLIDEDDDFSVSPGEKLYEMKSTTTRDNLIEYIDKYPLDRKRTIAWVKEKELEDVEDYRENPESRHRLAMFMSTQRHQKCKKLLFRILSDKIEGWWD